MLAKDGYPRYRGEKMVRHNPRTSLCPLTFFIVNRNLKVTVLRLPANVESPENQVQNEKNEHGYTKYSRDKMARHYPRTSLCPFTFFYRG